MRRLLDWLASATCSWEYVMSNSGRRVVVVRGWWPIHARDETLARFHEKIREWEAARPAPARESEAKE